MKHVRTAFGFLALAWLAVGSVGYGKDLEKARIRSTPTTYCNPVNISYRFMLKEADNSPSCREAADPTVVRYRDEYYLFASKSGCYWRSSDRVNWVPIPMDTGYVVRFGIAPDKLYLQVQVEGETSLEIRGLNRGVPYTFAVDSYNENGITEGTARVTLR